MIKKYYICCLFLFSFIPNVLLSQDPLVPASDPNNWTRRWNDDPSRYSNDISYDTNWDIGFYNDKSAPDDYEDSPDNVYIKSNILTLQSTMDCSAGSAQPISTGFAQTSNRAFYYGYFEANIQYISKGPYIWNAFWMWNSYSNCTASDSWYNEIDNEVYQDPYYNPDNLMYTHGCPYASGAACDFENNEPFAYGNYTYNNQPAPAYHTYGIEWDPDQVIWYLDKVPIWEFREGTKTLTGPVPNNGLFGHVPCNPLMIALGMGFYNIVDWNMSNVYRTLPINTLPSFMNVKYVNYYTYNQDCGTDYTVPSFDPSTFPYKVYKSITLGYGTGNASDGGTPVVLRASDHVLIQTGPGNSFIVPAGQPFMILPTQCFQTQNAPYNYMNNGPDMANWNTIAPCIGN